MPLRGLGAIVDTGGKGSPPGYPTGSVYMSRCRRCPTQPSVVRFGDMPERSRTALVAGGSGVPVQVTALNGGSPGVNARPRGAELA